MRLKWFIVRGARWEWFALHLHSSISMFSPCLSPNDSLDKFQLPAILNRFRIIGRKWMHGSYIHKALSLAFLLCSNVVPFSKVP